MHTLVPGECRVHEMRTHGAGREGRQPRGAAAPASSDPSGSSAMRPAAASPDDPEEVDPLPEAVPRSRRASRAWDRPVSAPPPPPGARPPARHAAVGSDEFENGNPFEDEDEDDNRSVDADEGFDYGDEPAAPSAPSGGAPPARAKREKKEKKVDAGTQAESGPAEWTSHDMRRSLRLLPASTREL